MLNQRVANNECFSSFALNIRCATYPPPPGSAPGYHVAHQLTETYTRNVIIGIQAEPISGTKPSTEPRPLAASLVFIASIPRSEERRVGKECRSRWSPDHERKERETR